MPKFNYVAMDARGKPTKGTLDVASQNEAISRQLSALSQKRKTGEVCFSIAFSS